MSAFDPKRASLTRPDTLILASGAPMRRRDFISFLGGAAAAQQSERMRRVSVLTGIGGTDAETKICISGFLQSLERLGWTEGRNLQVDIRGGAGSSAAVKKYAAELVTLEPDVATGSVVVPALLEATRKRHEHRLANAAA